MKNPSLSQMVNSELHISNSQIFIYSQCSLKYQFQYVEHRPPERISIALPFGSAIHSAIEMYYRAVKNSGNPEPLEAIIGRFEDCLSLDLDHSDIPVIYKKEAPDMDSVIKMGKAILKSFYESVDLKGMEIVDVEMPLSATLYTDEGQQTDFKLIGVIDLLLMDENRELIVVDNKTAAKPMAQSTADDDTQMTAYSYLLAANKFIFPTAPVKCRFDLLRKLKKPKVQHVYTSRTSADRKRFAKLSNAILAAVAAQIFFPKTSWMCGDCAHKRACQQAW
jgi:putative RecB family exonuclease